MRECGFELFAFVINVNQRDNDAAHGEPLGRVQPNFREASSEAGGSTSRDWAGGALLSFFMLLFAILTAASAAAFFCASRPAVFFQQPVCLQPHSWGFWQALWLGVGFGLLLVVCCLSGFGCSVDMANNVPSYSSVQKEMHQLGGGGGVKGDNCSQMLSTASCACSTKSIRNLYGPDWTLWGLSRLIPTRCCA